MVTSIKTPTTIDEQVLQLQERGMVIGDCADLKTWLRTVGYYKLSGYWWIYEDQYPKSSPRTHKFKDGTSWNRVKHTYIFDQKFRRLISTGIEKIEIAVKASWAQHSNTLRYLSSSRRPFYIQKRCLRKIKNQGATYRI